MGKFDEIRITDSFTARVQVASSRLATFNDAIDDSGSLIVRIPMTHSGIVTRNAGFYQPVKMMSGGKSFTDGFERPLQIGHGSRGLFSSSDGEPEVIGRVKQANFIDTSAEILKKDKKLEKLFKQHLSKDADEAREAAIEMAKHIDKRHMKDGGPKKGFEGLGFLEGIISVPDREAAQKIIDGRFNTVSISVASNAAFCTACATGDNLVDTGGCDHRRGEMVDGERSLIVLDELRYAHVAIVNEPADPLAANFELVNSEDSITLDAVDFLSSDNLEVAAKCFLFYNLDKIQPLDTDKDINLVQIGDAIGGITSAMGKKKTKTDDIVDPKVAEAEAAAALKAQQDAVTPPAEPTDDPSTQDDGANKDDPIIEEKDKAGDGSTGDPAAKADSEVVIPTDLFLAALKDNTEIPEDSHLYIEDFFSGEEFAEDKAEEYTKNFKEFYDSMIDYSDLTAEDGYKYFEEILADDAKLTPEALKELPKVSFCGPKGSFPASDGAHIDAARALLKRAKTSAATKKRISNSLDRRAKALNYVSSSQADIDTNNQPCDNTKVIQDFSTLETPDLKTWFDKVREELETRNIFDSVSGLKDLKEQVEVLDAQLESAYEELDSYSEKEVSYEDAYKELLATRLIDLKVLNGETIEDRVVALDELKTRTIESLKDSVKDLDSSTDMNSIANKINNGISREPTGNVENPVLQDSSKENTAADNSKKAEKLSQTSAIYDAYEKMSKTYGKDAADRYITTLRKQGKLPKNYLEA